MVSKRSFVVVTVSGGVAEVLYAPDTDVLLLDFDNLAEDDAVDVRAHIDDLDALPQHIRDHGIIKSVRADLVEVLRDIEED